ncbi:retrovirus-related pol polyprotein from transposon TNT 1-94 [Tanacetum coccineum]
MALGYQNPFYLKETQQKQQSLYNGKVLLEKQDPRAVYDFEETLQLAQENPAKFVRDFKSLTKEANESLAKHKALEFEIEHLLRAVLSQDIMSIGQSNSVVDTSNLQTELDHTKEKLERCIIKKEKEYDVSEQKDITKGTSVNTKFVNQLTKRKPSLQSLRNNFVVRQPNAFQFERLKFSKTQVPPKVVETNDLSNPITSNSVPTTTESKVMTNDKVIAPGMFRINSFKTSKEDKFVPINKVRESVRTNPITVLQPYVITKKHVNSDSNGLSSTGVDNTAKTRRPQSRSNKKNDRVPSASKSSCIKNKDVEVKEHHKNILPSKNKKHMSSEFNNVKLDIRNDKSEVICAMCKQCLLTSNHDFLGTIRFGNNHVAAILGYGDLQWGNILITRVYFVEGLGNNLFSVGQFFDSDLEVALRRNTCFVRNLEGVDLLKGNRTTNLYTINLYEMASISPICLIAWATSMNVGISYQASSVRTPQQNGVVEQRNRTQVEAARIMLIFSRAPLFIWAEAIATACYTRNRSIIHRRFNKTPYELINGIKLDISFLHVFRALCYPKNDHEDIRKLAVKGDIGFFIGYSTTSCAYRVYNRWTKKIIKTINVTFDELSAMAFEQSSSKPRLQGMTS